MTLAILLALVAPMAAQDNAVDLKVGDPAPKFQVLDDRGKAWKSEDYFGKKIVVLYFYPASFTGGCSAQARAFQADQKRFSDDDIEIVGASGDTVKGQEAFKRLNKLEFTLLSDEKGVVARLFGVPVKPGGTVKQRIEGKEEEFTRGVTIDRWTFVIDQAGKIAYKNTKVKPEQDSRNVLDVIRKLK
jgi:thioredoxin-dependent peroxiredoxin